MTHRFFKNKIIDIFERRAEFFFVAIKKPQCDERGEMNCWATTQAAGGCAAVDQIPV